MHFAHAKNGPFTVQQLPEAECFIERFAGRLIRPSVEPLVLLSCPEHAPHLFYKLGKTLGQNAMGSTVAILICRLFHVFRRRILTRPGQSEARPDRTHRFLGFHGRRDRCCLRLLLHAGA